MLEPRDLEQLVLLGTPAVHPQNSKQAVLAKAVMSVDDDAYISRLVVVNTGTGEEKLLLPADATTTERPQDHSPQWAPDGEKLAFLRRIQGRDELWLYDQKAGTVRSLTPQGKVKSFRFSPDGSKLVYISRVNDVNPVAYKVNRLRYKFDGEGMTNGYLQLFLIDLEKDALIQLTTRSSDHSVPVFSLDGKTLYYVSEYPEDDDLDKFPTIHKRDLASGEEISYRPELKSVTALYPLPNGSLLGIGKRHMAESTEIDKWFSWREDTQQTAWDHHQPEVHIGSHLISDSRRPGNLRTAVRRGDQLIFLATYQGRQSLYIRNVHDDRGEYIRIPIPMNVVSYDVLACDRESCSVLFVGDSMQRPGELYRADWRYGEEIKIIQLTDHHAELMKRLPIVEIREYKVPSADGTIVHGWSISGVATSADGDPKPRRMGTQLWIHGGPHMAYGDVFHYDFWYMASLGYRVIFCNPRGSTGYGQAFASAVVGEWGTRDVEEIMQFMEHVLVEEGRDPKEPLYILGGSYGGYLVNWIVSHDHRFTAAVTERSICNLYSKIGNSDNGFYNSLHQFGRGKDLWTHEQEIMERSPIRYAPQVETPILIIHAEQDHRCPIEQAEQWYIALRRLGKQVEFLRLPGAAHAYATAGRPKQRAVRLQVIQEWLSEHR